MLRTKPLSSRPSSNSFAGPYATKSLSPLGSRKRVNVVSFTPGTDGQELITKSPEKPPSDTIPSSSFDPFSLDSSFHPGTSLGCDNVPVTGLPVVPRRDMALNPSFKRMHVSSSAIVQPELLQTKSLSSHTDDTRRTVNLPTREVGSIVSRTHVPGVKSVLADGATTGLENISARNSGNPVLGTVDVQSTDRLASATRLSQCNASLSTNTQLSQGSPVNPTKPLGLSRTNPFPFPPLNPANIEDHSDSKKPTRTLLCGKNKRVSSKLYCRPLSPVFFGYFVSRQRDSVISLSVYWPISAVRVSTFRAQRTCKACIHSFHVPIVQSHICSLQLHFAS